MNEKKELEVVTLEIVEEAAKDAVLQIEGVSKEKEVKLNIEHKDHLLFIDVNIFVDFGIKIPELAWNIQTKVKEQVEIASNNKHKVKEVNIHVLGVI